MSKIANYPDSWFAPWKYENFNPNSVVPIKDCEEFLKIVNSRVKNGCWVINSYDYFWEDFRSHTYVPEERLQVDTFEHMWATSRGWHLPVVFKTRQEAIQCIKDRFEPFNKNQVATGHAHEQLVFKTRKETPHMVRVYAQTDERQPNHVFTWESQPTMDDLLALINMFVLQVTPENRKYFEEYLRIEGTENARAFFKEVNM